MTVRIAACRTQSRKCRGDYYCSFDSFILRRTLLPPESSPRVGNPCSVPAVPNLCFWFSEVWIQQESRFESWLILGQHKTQVLIVTGASRGIGAATARLAGS